MVTLKTLSQEALGGAVEKAHRYRLLNEPAEAESICLDVLAVEPDHQQALATLVLALTDQFADGSRGSLERARAILPRLRDPYERAYYGGIVCERRAKALLRRDSPGSVPVAARVLRDAMERFEQAERLRPPANDDALLRWNTCARLLLAHPELQVIEEEAFESYLE